MSMLRSKMFEERKKHLNEERGLRNRSSVTTVTDARSVQPKWFTKYSWSILLALLGVVIFFWKIHTPGLETSQIGSWAWSDDWRWIWILIFFGILFVLIAINEAALGKAAGILRNVLAGTMIMILVVLPIWGWLTEVGTPHSAKAAVCPDYSAHETRGCTIGTDWSNWIKPVEGPEINGMQLCFTRGGQFERKNENGTTFFRFKMDKGSITKSYRLCSNSEKCPSVLP